MTCDVIDRCDLHATTPPSDGKVVASCSEFAPRTENEGAPCVADARGVVSSVLLAMPFDVRLVVGTTRLSLHELGALQAGDILSFATRVGDPLTLWVGDQQVGQGDLILEGDLISLWVTHVAPAFQDLSCS